MHVLVLQVAVWVGRHVQLDDICVCVHVVQCKWLSLLSVME